MTAATVPALALTFHLLSHFLPATITGQAVHSCINNRNDYTPTGQAVHSCIKNQTYCTPNNTLYQINLAKLLSRIPTIIHKNGFYGGSTGRHPDKAYVAVLCRGDVDLDTCRECVQEATAALLESCPDRKQAIIWDSWCMLRYSNEKILGKLAFTPRECLKEGNVSTSSDEFREQMLWLVSDIRKRVMDGGNRMKIAAGNVMGPHLQKTYALVQCTPDLNREECNECISDAASDISLACNTYTGCRIYRPSCIIFYASYSFFNESRIEEVARGAVASINLLPDDLPDSLPPDDLPDDKYDGHNTNLIISGSIATVCTMLAVFAVILLSIRRRLNRTRRLDQDGSENGISIPQQMQYSLSKIRAATSNFSELKKIGEGGFGIVYKGMLENGQEIAVKRLSHDSSQGSVQFMNEVIVLPRLLHKNLVKLLGFCLEGKEKLIVYEYVPNGSLDRILFDPALRSRLDWCMRLRIIEGIARGLAYMHGDFQLTIIHCDVKASNILLDKEMEAKITDFGMAKVFDNDRSHESTSRVAGTYAYMAPEYAMHGILSSKVDVFSFGVLTLEIISGRKNTCIPSDSAPNFLSFVWRNWHDGTYVDVVDPCIGSSSSTSMNDMLRCIHIGLLCVQQIPTDRPTMASVVSMLEGNSKTMPVPSRPAFYFQNVDDKKCTTPHNSHATSVNSSVSSLSMHK